MAIRHKLYSFFKNNLQFFHLVVFRFLFFIFFISFPFSFASAVHIQKHISTYCTNHFYPIFCKFVSDSSILVSFPYFVYSFKTKIDYYYYFPFIFHFLCNIPILLQSLLYIHATHKKHNVRVCVWPHKISTWWWFCCFGPFSNLQIKKYQSNECTKRKITYKR